MSDTVQATLISLVGNHLLDSNNLEEQNEEFRANTEQNIADAITLLPKLTTGMFDLPCSFCRACSTVITFPAPVGESVS